MSFQPLAIRQAGLELRIRIPSSEIFPDTPIMFDWPAIVGCQTFDYSTPYSGLKP